MGVRWLVGSGESISITNQPWLAEDDNPYITSVSQTFENNSVASLMCCNSRTWDEEILRDLFNERDQQCILRVPLSSTREVDRVYWCKEKSGIYSVKSAYKLLHEHKGMWRTVDNGSLWSNMWKIKAPPKTLNLVWRALSFCLPTMTMLALRHVPVLSTCPVCNGDEETIMHAMVTCPFVTLCWQRILPEVQQEVGDNFVGWLELVLSKVNPDRRALVVTVWWAIWKARNEKHWNQKVSSMNVVLALAKQYLVQWKNAQGRSTEALIQSKFEGDGATTWVKPQTDTIKVTVDAAIFREQEAFGLGMVARDSQDNLVEARSLFNTGVVSPEFAEAITMKEALSWIKAHAWEPVVIEADCLAVVQAVRSKVSMLSPFGMVIEDCRKCFVDLNEASLVFVRRSANMTAHYVAKMSCSFPGRVITGSDVPIDFMNILLADLV